MDCVGDLQCFHRTSSTVTVPGCALTGYVKTAGTRHGYCHNPKLQEHTENCECNGRTDTEGAVGPDCRTLHQGRAHCYVDSKTCIDGKPSSELHNTDWSFAACAGRVSERFRVVGAGECRDGSKHPTYYASQRTAETDASYKDDKSWCEAVCDGLPGCTAYDTVVSGTGYCFLYGNGLGVDHTCGAGEAGSCDNKGSSLAGWTRTEGMSITHYSIRWQSLRLQTVPGNYNYTPEYSTLILQM